MIEERKQYDGDVLRKVALSDAMEIFGDAIDTIDAEFGEGYAKEHPEMVAAFMKTVTYNFNTERILHDFQPIALRSYELLNRFIFCLEANQK